MELTDLRTCDRCRGPIIFPPGNWFWIVRVTGALVTSRLAAVDLYHDQAPAPRLHPATATMLEHSAAGAEVLIAGDRDPSLSTELVLCSDCYGRELDLAGLCRSRRGFSTG